MNKKSLLVFGVGELQKSIIERAKAKDLFVIGIDPDNKAFCKDIVDVFEEVGGEDYEKTLAIAEKYRISGLITAATDKPLVMMAQIAKKLNLSFYSVETAIISTDKYLMKEQFLERGIPCAKGKLISRVDEIQDLKYPLIIKPRDNSGSRGVILCNDFASLKWAFKEAQQYTKKNTILVEEYIEGKEYSIESLHWNGYTEVIQFTEKRVTSHPYNVELGHIQPAQLSDEVKDSIRTLINKVAHCLHFENCASHTELKVNDRGIFIIETSPRLGGDFITSELVPLSTGINIEDILLQISLGNDIEKDTVQKQFCKYSAVNFLILPEGIIRKINRGKLTETPGVIRYSLKLKEGDHVPRIVNSLSRYGEIIFQTDTRAQLDKLISKTENYVREHIFIN